MLNNFAFLAITETCISESTKHCINLIAGRKYSLFQVFRTNSRGGGITLFLKNEFKAKVINSSVSPHLEFLSLGVTLYRKTFLIIVYRPPPGSITSFFEQFSDLLFTLRSPPLGIKLILLKVFQRTPIALAILILIVSKPSAEKESWREP